MKYRILNIRSVREAQLREWFASLPLSERERLLRFRKTEDQLRSLCANQLAREMLAEELGISPEALAFQREKRGKPYIKGNPLHFNLSHSGNYALCVVDTSPIGADIEFIRPIRSELCHRVCTDDEFSFVYSSGIFDSRRFLQLWTAKEAVLKQDGHGISSSIKSLSLVRAGALYHPKLHLIQECTEEYVLTIAKQQKPPQE